MKKIFTIIATVVITAGIFLPKQANAQAPEKMSYQAVIRDASNNLVTNQAVGMQISILQGSADGSAVYTETQTATSNANGLVSIEIGTGIIVSGDFTTIDWANGPYFIKTETDPTGGTTYTITGTTQLMSVPYALHAKTAESITGGITETDPTYTASEAANITANDITTLSNTSGTNTGDQTVITAVQATAITTNTAKTGVTAAQATAITANTAKTGVTTTQATIIGNTSGTNTGDQTISRTGTTVTLSNGGGTFIDSVGVYTAGAGIGITNNVISTSDICGLSIGDAYQGGIIFYLDATGCHGLIAATADQGAGIQWYNGSFTTTNAVRDGIGAGEFNTERIIANQGSGAYAAQICANYQGGNYGDWYLPSKYELNLLYLQKTVFAGFVPNGYWSSTENGSGNAWRQDFGAGSQDFNTKLLPFYVRAVRAF